MGASQADGRRFDVFFGLNIFLCKPSTCQGPFWVFFDTATFSKIFINLGISGVSIKKAFFEAAGSPFGYFCHSDRYENFQKATLSTLMRQLCEPQVGRRF